MMRECRRPHAFWIQMGYPRHSPWRRTLRPGEPRQTSGYCERHSFLPAERVARYQVTAISIQALPFVARPALAARLGLEAVLSPSPYWIPILEGAATSSFVELASSFPLWLGRPPPVLSLDRAPD